MNLDFAPYLDGSAAVATLQGTFTEVEHFLGSRPNDLHLVVSVDQNDRATVRFGDGVSGAPPQGTIALTYKTGGGAIGNVDADRLVVVEGSFNDAFGTAVRVCGELRTAAFDRNAATNPTIVVEVTSRSTEDYDRGEKLSHYKQIPSLSAVFIVSHRRRQITALVRGASGFEVHELRSGESLVLASPALTLATDEVYAGVALEGE